MGDEKQVTSLTFPCTGTSLCVELLTLSVSMDSVGNSRVWCLSTCWYILWLDPSTHGPGLQSPEFGVAVTASDDGSLASWDLHTLQLLHHLTLKT